MRPSDQAHHRRKLNERRGWGLSSALFLRPDPARSWVEIHRKARAPDFLGLKDIGWRETRRTVDYGVDISVEMISGAVVMTDDTSERN